MATKTQRVRVSRAFYHKGEPYGRDSVLDLPLPTAIELRTANKVEFVQSDVKPNHVKDVAPPVDARDSGETVDNGKKKEPAK